MHKTFQAVYVPMGVGTFHMPTAEEQFQASIAMLREYCQGIIVPEEKILSTDQLSAYLDTLEPDLIILQNMTFANGAYASEVMHRFRSVPLLLWTLREPVIDGGRLRLNALTGAFSAANTIRQFKQEPFEYVYGGPEEPQVRETAKKMINAAITERTIGFVMIFFGEMTFLSEVITYTPYVHCSALTNTIMTEM